MNNPKKDINQINLTQKLLLSLNWFILSTNLAAINRDFDRNSMNKPDFSANTQSAIYKTGRSFWGAGGMLMDIMYTTSSAAQNFANLPKEKSTHQNKLIALYGMAAICLIISATSLDPVLSGLSTNILWQGVAGAIFSMIFVSGLFIAAFSLSAILDKIEKSNDESHTRQYKKYLLIGSVISAITISYIQSYLNFYQIGQNFGGAGLLLNNFIGAISAIFSISFMVRIIYLNLNKTKNIENPNEQNTQINEQKTDSTKKHLINFAKYFIVFCAINISAVLCEKYIEHFFLKSLNLHPIYNKTIIVLVAGVFAAFALYYGGKSTDGLLEGLKTYSMNNSLDLQNKDIQELKKDLFYKKLTYAAFVPITLISASLPCMFMYAQLSSATQGVLSYLRFDKKFMPLIAMVSICTLSLFSAISTRLSVQIDQISEQIDTLTKENPRQINEIPHNLQLNNSSDRMHQPSIQPN